MSTNCTTPVRVLEVVDSGNSATRLTIAAQRVTLKLAAVRTKEHEKLARMLAQEALSCPALSHTVRGEVRDNGYYGRDEAHKRSVWIPSTISNNFVLRGFNESP